MIDADPRRPIDKRGCELSVVYHRFPLLLRPHGTNVIGGGAVSLNAGPGWKAIGTGDFYGNGLSDILWQNVNGQVAIWEMNGTSQIPGGTQALSMNPGPSWHVIKSS